MLIVVCRRQTGSAAVAGAASCCPTISTARAGYSTLILCNTPPPPPALPLARAITRAACRYGFCSSSSSLAQVTAKAQAQSSSGADPARTVLSLEDVRPLLLPALFFCNTSNRCSTRRCRRAPWSRPFARTGLLPMACSPLSKRTLPSPRSSQRPHPLLPPPNRNPSLLQLPPSFPPLPPPPPPPTLQPPRTCLKNCSCSSKRCPPPTQ
jgi:hypothetical protein